MAQTVWASGIPVQFSLLLSERLLKAYTWPECYTENEFPAYAALDEQEKPAPTESYRPASLHPDDRSTYSTDLELA